VRHLKTWAWTAAAASTLAIGIATLHSSGGTTRGWSFYLTSGDAALGELIANLILFIPLGVSLTLAGVRPLRVVAAGALLSFTVEFLQQWIPGRDPSLGDIVANSISTALGVLLVVAAPRWLHVSPRRSAWQARLTAALAVFVWYGTGLLVRQKFPPGPYNIVPTPRIHAYANYEGQVLKITPGFQSVEVRAIAPATRPGRTSPLLAGLARNDERVLMLAVDDRDLTLGYDMPALHWTLEVPPLRLRDGMTQVAPSDTFTVATWHDSTNICLRVNATTRCNLGYTIGDGWKLIYSPEHWAPWLLGTINTLWMAGCVIGVGFWGAAAKKGGGGLLAMGLVVAGLLMVPLLTGLKPTAIYEWIGAVGGMALGYWLRGRYDSPNRPIELHDV
jgi:VanZ like protein